MSDHLSRVTLRNATFGGGIFEVLTITGHVIVWEPEAPAKREILRPVAHEEPDTDIEVGYSKSIREPLTLEYQGCKAKLTETAFILFQYVNELYRTEGRTEFEFLELSDYFFGKSSNAIGKLTRQIVKALANIAAPFTITFEREILYVDTNIGMPS